MIGGRGKNKVMIIAILLSVIVLTIGFAAFSSSLLIKTNLSVNPDSSTFGVVFSSSSTLNPDGTVVIDPIEPVKSDNSITTTNAEINNEDVYPTISNLGAVFTKPGQSVTYTFYAINNGKFDAYLTSIIFNKLGSNATNSENSEKFKECVSKEDATDSLTQAACNNINVNVKVSTLSNTNVVSTTDTNLLNIQDHVLLMQSGSNVEKVTITFSYATGGVYVDGPFEVNLGDIYLTYGTTQTAEMPNVGPICTAVTSSEKGNVPTGNFNLGDEYTCKVNNSQSYNFYVLSAEEDNVNLIMTENLVNNAYFVGGPDATNVESFISSDEIVIINQLDTLTYYWSNIPKRNETYNESGNDGYSGYYYSISLIGRARLPKYEEIADKICTTKVIKDDGTEPGYFYKDCESWILGNYWTMSNGAYQDFWAMNTEYNTLDTTAIWKDDVYYEENQEYCESMGYTWDEEIGKCGQHFYVNKHGIRPVITLSKANFTN